MAIDETIARIACPCGEEFQVLREWNEMRELEIIDEEGNITGYESVEVTVTDWDAEATQSLAQSHANTCPVVN